MAKKISPPPPTAQPPAARRAAETELRRLISHFAPTQLRLVAALRRSLRSRLPTAHELVYEYRDAFITSFSPSEHGYEGVLAIHGSAKGVQLYFNQGKTLPDPAKLLRGSGSQVRSLPIPTAATLTRPAVAALIDTALARNPVPFAPTGHGSVTIRPTSAQQRRLRHPA